MGASMAMPISTEIGVTTPSNVSTTVAVVTQPEIGSFVPPFTTNIHVSIVIPISPYPQVRAILNDRFIAMKNFIREQPFGMPTSMMASLQNNAFTFADHANPFTLYNAHSPLGSSIIGRNVPPTLTTESMISLRQQMGESNHEMVNMLT